MIYLISYLNLSISDLVTHVYSRRTFFLIDPSHNFINGSNSGWALWLWCIASTIPWVPVDSKIRGGLLLVLEGSGDILVITVGNWVWILDNLVGLVLEPSRVPATRRCAYWIRVKIGTGLNAHPLGIMLTSDVLSKVKGVLGSNHVTIENWVIIVHSLLGWVDWWLLKLEVPVVSNDLLSNGKISEVIIDVFICAEVDDWVINVVSSLLLGVLVLGASSGGADRVRLNLGSGLNEVPWLELVSLSGLNLVD